MPDTPAPLGLPEADENNLRVLLTKVREHDPEYLVLLMMECLTYTQPPESTAVKRVFDADDILVGCIVSARGTVPATRLIAAVASAAGGE